MERSRGRAETRTSSTSKSASDSGRVTELRAITPTVARRLAITGQQLAGPGHALDRGGIMDVARSIGCLQLDPISVVARSHQLVLWSRLGPYDLADLDALLWEERRLFEFWAHRASIVLTEHYPIHRLLMRGYPRGVSTHRIRTRLWLEENRALKREVLARLRSEGPLPARAFEHRSARGWESGGWTSGRNVSRMLDVLWIQGRIMVARRQGIQKVWDLTERVLPPWTPRERLSDREITRRAAQISLRALGIAQPGHIGNHFTIGRYPGFASVLAEHERNGTFERVRIAGDGIELPGPWFVHSEDLPLLAALERGEWEPRTTLLSPFDNLITDRARTELMFDFYFRMEIYVPQAQRKFGYYALPILHGDRLIGQVDPAMDRGRGRLVVKAVHSEPGAPKNAGRAVAGAVASLGEFLGAREIEYSSAVPEAWRRVLR
jgi:uncharacterized protein YcaQ